jgi:hypothetical protein
MASAATSPKQQAHELIDSMAPGQVAAVIPMLRIVADPFARSLANAPYEDELISEEENRAVAASKAWLKDHEPIPMEEVLAEFGLTAEDFEHMGRTPLEPEPRQLGQ